MLSRLIKLLFLVALLPQIVRGTPKPQDPGDDDDQDDCTRFYMEAHRGSISAAKVGYLTWTSDDEYASLTTSKTDAMTFHLGRDNGLHPAQRKFAASPSVSYGKRGYGPLKVFNDRTKYSGGWGGGGGGEVYYYHRAFTYGAGDAIFCYDATTFEVYGQYRKPVPAELNCKPIIFRAACVNELPQPSDGVQDLLPRATAEPDMAWRAAVKGVLA